jgi:transposase
MKNKHVKRSKISEAKFCELVRLFSLDLDAQNISLLTHLNRNTVHRYLYLLRKRIEPFCEEKSSFHGEVEVDESYFGGKRIKGKWGRGAASKTPVFGILYFYLFRN